MPRLLVCGHATRAGAGDAQMIQRRVVLDVDEARVADDVEHGLGPVDHFPHDQRGDLDRAAFQLAPRPAGGVSNDSVGLGASPIRA